MLFVIENRNVQVNRKSGYPAEKVARAERERLAERQYRLDKDPYRCYLAGGVR